MRSELSGVEGDEQESRTNQDAQTQEGEDRFGSIPTLTRLERENRAESTGDKEFHQLRDSAEGVAGQMIPENARNETINWQVISAVTDDDEISLVQFGCACGHWYNPPLRIEETGKIDGTLAVNICERRCPECLNYSGLNFMNIEKDLKAEEVGKLTERQNMQKYLCDALSGDLRHLRQETRQIIGRALEGRNLKLQFGIKKAQKR
jgi:hypothetical protein